MNPPLVQKSSVAAAEINQPKFADILQVDEGVPTRHFGRIQDDCIRSRASDRTTAADRIACAIGRFQPGTFLWGCVHAEKAIKTNTGCKASDNVVNFGGET